MLMGLFGLPCLVLLVVTEKLSHYKQADRQINLKLMNFCFIKFNVVKLNNNLKSDTKAIRLYDI